MPSAAGPSLPRRRRALALSQPWLPPQQCRPCVPSVSCPPRRPQAPALPSAGAPAGPALWLRTAPCSRGTWAGSLPWRPGRRAGGSRRCTGASGSCRAQSQQPRRGPAASSTPGSRPSCSQEASPVTWGCGARHHLVAGRLDIASGEERTSLALLTWRRHGRACACKCISRSPMPARLTPPTGRAWSWSRPRAPSPAAPARWPCTPCAGGPPLTFPQTGATRRRCWTEGGPGRATSEACRKKDTPDGATHLTWRPSPPWSLTLTSLVPSAAEIWLKCAQEHGR